MKANKDKLFTAKVDENLLKAFKHACENQDTTASQAVRAFMRDYVKKHGQAKLLTKKSFLCSPYAVGVAHDFVSVLSAPV